jgi:hypothetical protein
MVIEGNVFEGDYSGAGDLPGPKVCPRRYRQDHVSPQGLVSVRTINLNGVSRVTLKGNVFTGAAAGSENITHNVCECCTVVDTPQDARCAEVKILA